MALNKNSNLYTFGFAFSMVVIVGTLLAIASEGLKELQEKNKDDKKMINILGAINVNADRSNAKELFNKYVIDSKIISGNNPSAQAFAIDIQKEFRDKNLNITDRNYPLYECRKEGNT
jgi:Na+-transporting NADH:ubiquinone oxidoreductase subunit C